MCLVSHTIISRRIDISFFQLRGFDVFLSDKAFFIEFCMLLVSSSMDHCRWLTWIGARQLDRLISNSFAYLSQCSAFAALCSMRFLIQNGKSGCVSVVFGSSLKLCRVMWIGW